VQLDYNWKTLWTFVLYLDCSVLPPYPLLTFSFLPSSLAFLSFLFFLSFFFFEIGFCYVAQTGLELVLGSQACAVHLTPF
jgi:hypothetical protein